MKRVLTALAALLILHCVAAAQEDIDGFRAREFRSRDGAAPLPYRLYSPRVEDGERYPLVIFLHGAGKAQGSDNISQLTAPARMLGGQKVQSRHPAFVAVPQCPGDDSWLKVRIPDAYKRYERQVMSTPEQTGGYRARREALWDIAGDRTIYFPTVNHPPTEALGQVLELIDSLCAELPVDTDRVYMLGGSMGGYGTWIAAMNIPEKLAAIAPLQGGGDPGDVEAIKQLPIWIFHGGADVTVPPQSSRDMYVALRRAGARRTLYTELPGVVHGQLTSRAMNYDADKDGYPDLIEWLFRQRLVVND
jgi:predicted peptidase